LGGRVVFEFDRTVCSAFYRRIATGPVRLAVWLTSQSRLAFADPIIVSYTPWTRTFIPGVTQ
jgi:hypothetical protein